MIEKWKTPKWMKKYVKYLIIDSEKTLEEWMDDKQIVVLTNPCNFVRAARVKAQVRLLEQLHKKGIIK